MFRPGGRRLYWLWGLCIALSALNAASPVWLPASSGLRNSLCRWTPGLAACRGH